MSQVVLTPAARRGSDELSPSAFLLVPILMTSFAHDIRTEAETT
jgi:hypothetical protein